MRIKPIAADIPAAGACLWLIFELTRGGAAWTPAFFLAAASLWALRRRHPDLLWIRHPRTAIFLAALTAYLSTFRWHGGDDAPNSLLPFCVLRFHTLALDPVISPWFIGKTTDFTLLYGIHRLSVYPILPGILAIPLYLPAAIAGTVPNEQMLHNLSKIAGSIVTASSAVFFFQAVRKRCSLDWSFCLAALFGLGTWAFSVSSQALWQHGPASLGLALALWGLNETGPAFDVLIGFGCAFAVAARPDSIFFAAAIGAYILFHQSRRRSGFPIGTIPPLAFLAGYWLHYTGRLAPPESGFQSAIFTRFQPGALRDLMISPTRGLLFFFPAAVFGIWAGLKRLEDPLVRWLLSACLGPWIIMTFYSNWVGGNTFGPRYFALAAMVLIYLCADAEREIRSDSKLRAAWVAVMMTCILIHALGAYMTWPGSQFIEAEKTQLWRWRLHPIAQLFAADGWLRVLPAAARYATGSAILAAFAAAGARLNKFLAG